MNDREIFDILGIEEENREESRYLLAQFRKLCKKHSPSTIWLKGDYAKGFVAGETEDLVALEER